MPTKTKMELFVERLEHGRWKHVPGDFYTGEGQNTAAFALLAGVRNQMGIQPLRLPRRLPRLGAKTQVSPEVWKAYNVETGTHDHPTDKITTWYTFAELFRENWTKFADKWFETDFSIDTIARLRQLAEGKDPNHLRIVFWFEDTQVEVDLHDNWPYKFTVNS